MGWVTNHGWVLVPASIAAVAVELARTGRPRWAAGGATRWVAAAWLFHVGIAAVMAITFPYPLCRVAFAPFYDVETGWFSRRRRAAAAVASDGDAASRRSGA